MNSIYSPYHLPRVKPVSIDNVQSFQPNNLKTVKALRLIMPEIQVLTNLSIGYHGLEIIVFLLALF